MFEIVFQSEDWVAVDKPAGWLTVPSRYEEKDPRPVLGRELETKIGGRIFPTHRLDFEVGGLVLFARTPEAHRRAGKWFETRKVKKTYQGLSQDRDFSHWPADLKRAEGPIEIGETQEWTCRLLRGKRRSYEHPKGDTALTQVCRVAAHQWILFPFTGRAHQLRFEMSRHGYPLLGDSLYGSKGSWQSESEIALRAVRLDFSALSESERAGLPMEIAAKGLFE